MVSDNYLEILSELMIKHPDISIFAGSIVRDDNHKFYSLRHQKGGSLKFFRNTKNLMGSNFVIKRDVFLSLNMFDEDFGAGSYFGSSEETDFCWKAYFSGINMEFFPQLVVYHVPPFNESIKKGFVKSFKYGIGKGALVWKWLIVNKQPKVLFEFLEMFVVPIIQIFRGIFTLNLSLSASNIASVVGRLYGLFKGAVFYFKNS